MPDKFDLCVCNPPYLPDLGVFTEIKINHTVGGTGLLEHIISNGLKLSKETYINISNMAMPESLKAAENNGVVLKPVGKDKLVPFRVRTAFENPNYIKRMREEGRILKRYKQKYKYWHIINTYKLEPSGFR